MLQPILRGAGPVYYRIYSKNGTQDGILQEQANIRTSSSGTLEIDWNVSQALPSTDAALHWLWFIQVQIACLGTDGCSTNQRKTPSSMCCIPVLSTAPSTGHYRRWGHIKKFRLASVASLLDNEWCLHGGSEIYQQSAPLLSGTGAKADTTGKIIQDK